MTRRIVFDLSLLAFVASAAFGFWTTYDPSAFASRFWVLAVGAALALVIAHLRSARALTIAVVGIGLMGVALAARFFLFNDWSSPMWAGRGSKLALFDGVFMRLASVTPAAFAVAIEPDVVGGIAAVTLPLVVLLIVHAAQAGKRGWTVAWACAAIALGLMLCISLSFGAWLSAAVALAVWGAWRWLGKGKDAASAWPARMGVLGFVLVAGLALYAIVVFVPAMRDLPVVGGVATRAATWLYAGPLMRDYAFTGLGLGNFSAPYPVYALLTWFIISPRAYNLFADALIQQGVLGVMALMAFIVTSAGTGLQALRRTPADRAFMIEASLASLLAWLINGMLNNPLHGSDAAGLGGLVLFVPPALALAAGLQTLAADATERSSQAKRSRMATLIPAGLGAVAIAALALVWQPMRAAWHANLGAVAQTRAELRIYDPVNFGDPTIYAARRRADLTTAEAEFAQALVLDAVNATARQRLAQIAQARADYPAALAHAQALWDAGQRDAITRLTLGDAYAAIGRVADAAQITRGLSAANRRFAGLAWYEYWSAGDFQRAAWAYAAAVAIQPDDAESARMQAKAQVEAEHQAGQAK